MGIAAELEICFKTIHQMAALSFIYPLKQQACASNPNSRPKTHAWITNKFQLTFGFDVEMF